MCSFEYAIDILEGNGIGKNVKRGLEILKDLAYSGSLEAQFCLARFYWSGEYVQADNEKAIYWYEITANRGHAFSQLWLGNNYLNGTKTEVDYKKAAYWYRRAGENGVAIAWYNLGMCYLYGWGVKKNEEEGERLISIAAEGYILVADLTLLENRKNDLDVFEKEKQRIIKKYQKLIGVDKEITMELAEAFRKGYGVASDIRQAYELYNLSVLDEEENAIIMREKLKDNCAEGRYDNVRI